MTIDDTTAPYPATPAADVFACHADAPSNTLVWVIIAACAVLVAYTTKRLFSKDKTAPAEGYAAQMHDELIPNLRYLKESLRLSELMIAELTSAIQSYERKALAIIVSAAALIGFITTKDWCTQPIISVGFVSILFLGAAIGWAVFILAQSHTGYGGISPLYTVNYYEKLSSLDYPKEDKENVEQCYLCLAMLNRYNDVINASFDAAKRKEHRLNLATWAGLNGLIGTTGWLLIKVLPVVL